MTICFKRPIRQKSKAFNREKHHRFIEISFFSDVGGVVFCFLFVFLADVGCFGLGTLDIFWMCSDFCGDFFFWDVQRDLVGCLSWI